MNEKTLARVREITKKYDAVVDKFTYDFHKHMEYALIKANGKAKWVACCDILLMSDRVFKNF